jgi:hypothetical protein
MTGTRTEEREQTVMKACDCRIRPVVEPERGSDSRFIEPNFERNSPKGNGSVPGRARSHFLSRCLNFIGWVLPTAILALIPKCPVCVAGYAVIGTSVGFSLSRFAQVRLAIIVLCAASLLYLGTKSVLYVASRIAPKRCP